PTLRRGQRQAPPGRDGALAPVLLRDAGEFVRLSAGRRGFDRPPGRGGARPPARPDRRFLRRAEDRKRRPGPERELRRAALPPGAAGDDVSRRSRMAAPPGRPYFRPAVAIFHAGRRPPPQPSPACEGGSCWDTKRPSPASGGGRGPPRSGGRVGAI